MSNGGVSCLAKWEVTVVLDDSVPAQKQALDAVRNNVALFDRVSIQKVG